MYLKTENVCWILALETRYIADTQRLERWTMCRDAFFIAAISLQEAFRFLIGLLEDFWFLYSFSVSVRNLSLRP